MMSTATVDFTLVPAFVTGCPSTSTLPCAIQDCTTVRLNSGYRAIVSSSRRCLPDLGGSGGGEARRRSRPTARARRRGARKAARRGCSRRHAARTNEPI